MSEVFKEKASWQNATSDTAYEGLKNKTKQNNTEQFMLFDPILFIFVIQTFSIFCCSAQ